MIPIPSPLEGIQTTFQELKKTVASEDFHLGGGYTYGHGYFDKALDWEKEQHRYYLRIPVFALDDDLDKPKTRVEIGKPFVIKHEFLTKENDTSANVGLVSSLVNQFTEPVPSEGAEMDDSYISRAQSTLRNLEIRLGAR